MYSYTYICIYILCMCVYVFIVVSVCMYQHTRRLSALKPCYLQLYPPSFRFVYLIMILFFLFPYSERDKKNSPLSRKEGRMSRRNSRVYPSSDDLILPGSSSSKVRPSPPQDDPPTTVPSRGEQQSSFHQNLAGVTITKKGVLEEVACLCQYIAATSS